MASSFELFTSILSLRTTHYILHTAHCAVRIVQCALRSEQFAVRSSQFAVRSSQFAGCRAYRPMPTQRPHVISPCIGRSLFDYSRSMFLGFHSENLEAQSVFSLAANFHSEIHVPFFSP